MSSVVGPNCSPPLTRGPETIVVNRLAASYSNTKWHFAVVKIVGSDADSRYDFPQTTLVLRNIVFIRFYADFSNSRSERTNNAMSLKSTFRYFDWRAFKGRSLACINDKGYTCVIFSWPITRLNLRQFLEPSVYDVTSQYTRLFQKP